MSDNAQSQATNDVNVQAGASSTPAGTEAPSSPGENQAVETKPQSSAPVDWRSTPEFRGIAKENRKYKEQLAQMERKYAELEGKFSGFSQVNSRTSGIGQEDAQALERLAQLMLEHPKTFEMFKDKFGLSKISELEQGFQDLNKSWSSSQADSEMNQILDQAEKLGLNKDEVRDELERQVDEHPLYSQINYRPGALKALYRDIFFDRAGELRERALNQENIQKREALRRGQTQISSGQNGKSMNLSPDEKFRQIVKEAGGTGGIDFTK